MPFDSLAERDGSVLANFIFPILHWLLSQFFHIDCYRWFPGISFWGPHTSHFAKCLV